MSMVRVLQMLVDLHGEAASRDLLERAQRLWPRETLSKYAGSATCTRLLRWRFVELLPTGSGPRIWRITSAGRAWLAQQLLVTAGGTGGPAGPTPPATFPNVPVSEDARGVEP